MNSTGPQSALRSLKSRRGFTLVELLVVIAVIALLIAMLLPTLRMARDAGRASVCLSNMRQVAIATICYHNDHNFFYPSTFIGPPVNNVSQNFWLGKAGTAGGYLLADASLRYLNRYAGGPYPATAEVPVSRCPSDWDAVGGTNSFYNAYGASYSANADRLLRAPAILTLSSTAGPNYYCVNASAVRNPSRMVVMGEFGVFDPVWNNVDYAPLYHWHSTEMKWNLAYADGHGRFTTIVLGVASNADYTFSRDK